MGVTRVVCGGPNLPFFRTESEESYECESSVVVVPREMERCTPSC
jgi:hypothetical protein